MKKKLLFLSRALITTVLMAVLIYMVRDSIPKMADVVKRIPFYILLLGAALFFGSIYLASVRLKILLAAQGIYLDIASTAKLTLLGYFFSSFLPTSVGGDVMKAFYISKASNKAMKSCSSVFMDRFLGLASIFIIAAIALFCTDEIPKTYLKWLIPLLLVVSGIFSIFLFSKRVARMFSFFASPLLPLRIKDSFGEIYNSVYSFKTHRLAMLNCFLISVCGQIIAFSATYFFVMGLDSYIPLRVVLLVMPVASIVSMLPSINGTGPREMAVVIILSPFIGKDKALAVAFLWLGLILAAALIGGIIYAVTKQYKIKNTDLCNGIPDISGAGG